MQAARRLILAHGPLAALLCVAALALRMLVPAGYMIASDHGRIAITLCPGATPPAATMMAMPGMDHAMPGHGPSKEHDKAETPCAFTALSAQALGGADPLLLVVALAFVAAMALRAAPRATVPAAPHLRPFSRGPPQPGA